MLCFTFNQIWLRGMVTWAGWAAFWWYSSRAVSKTKQSEPNSSRYLHLAYLVLAFSLLFSNALNFHPLNIRFLNYNLITNLGGNVLTVAGLSFATWARVHLGQYWSGRITIKEDHGLIRSGPYRFVRHPIYTGFLLAIIGSAVVLGQLRGLFAVTLITFAYWIKIQHEEKVLLTQFGSQYLSYRREVKSLIPFVL